MHQRIRGVYVPPVPDRNGRYVSFAQAEHLTQLTSFGKKRFNVKTEGGLGIRTAGSFGYADPVFATLHASSKMEFGNILHVQTEIRLSGWRKVESPQWSVIFRFPFIK
jgi:hypothetical protein